jgi:transposase
MQTSAGDSLQTSVDALPVALPEDVAACHAMIQYNHATIQQLLDTHVEKDRLIEGLRHQLQNLLRRAYGRSSEKLDPNQLALFEKMLAELQGAQEASSQDTSATEPVPAQPVKESPKLNANGHGRRQLPASLERRDVVIDLPEDQKPCPCCHAMRVPMGDQISEKLDYEPAKVFVQREIRRKYVCRACEAAAREDGPQIVVADKPLCAVEKSLAAPGLQAQIIISKYADHQPLNRHERILARHGIELSRSTQWDCLRQCSEALLPLVKLMTSDVLASRVLHTDDTPVDVLDRQMPGTTRTGRFWVYVGDEDHPQIVFDYTSSRSRDGPMAFLKGWGKESPVYLQADAFGGYDGIYRGEAGGNVTEVACLAHCRRKFHDARNADMTTATQALAHVKLLYDVEDMAKAKAAKERGGESDPQTRRQTLVAERLRLRQEFAVPRLTQFKAWLESRLIANGGPVLPKSPMAQAITYALNQWDALCVYTTDGELNIDNNIAERALRRIAVGRGNWLFMGSDNGGRTAAILFSLIATCERHKVNPFEYLRDVLTRIAAHPMNRLAELLPHRWQLAPR